MGGAPPLTPPLAKPCKLVSGVFFLTHHASIVFANGGFRPPPTPPFYSNSNPSCVCVCCVCEWKGAAPTPRAFRHFSFKPITRALCLQMGGGLRRPSPRFILFRTHHVSVVFANGRCPTPRPRFVKPCKLASGVLFSNPSCEHCVCKWGRGCAPRNPGAFFFFRTHHSCVVVANEA